MRCMVENYVATLVECQRYKRPAATSPGLRHPEQLPTAPFEQVGIDLIGPLTMNSNFPLPILSMWVLLSLAH